MPRRDPKHIQFAWQLVRWRLFGLFGLIAYFDFEEIMMLLFIPGSWASEFELLWCDLAGMLDLFWPVNLWTWLHNSRVEFGRVCHYSYLCIYCFLCRYLARLSQGVL